MPINRFDTSVRPQYVSNHIGLPFQELNAIAANHQKSFDDGKATEDELGLIASSINSK